MFLLFVAPLSYMPPRRAPELKPTFFKTPTDFRKWLSKHHDRKTELWVGFHKKASGAPSITWPESVDEALCYGWIDGVRKSIDQTRYQIRFTPRRSHSIWSAVNIRRVAELTRDGRMQPPGQKAFANRSESKSGIYAYEQRQPELPETYAKELRKNRAAAKFFESQPPSYRKLAMWWIVSAKQEETRIKRLRKLIEASAAGRRI